MTFINSLYRPFPLEIVKKEMRRINRTALCQRHNPHLFSFKTYSHWYCFTSHTYQRKVWLHRKVFLLCNSTHLACSRHESNGLSCTEQVIVQWRCAASSDTEKISCKWLVSLQEWAVDFLRLVLMEEARKGHAVAIWILHRLGWIIWSWCGTRWWEIWVCNDSTNQLSELFGEPDRTLQEAGCRSQAARWIALR